jgi:hypothetical protein
MTRRRRRWSPRSRNLPNDREEFTFQAIAVQVASVTLRSVGVGEFVKLECRPETIRALAEHLERFGAVTGNPEWLVSAVWLCTPDAEYLATSSTRVLSDGYIARPLTIDRTDDFVRHLRSDLPDVASRLVARTGDADLPEPAPLRPPASLEQCPRPILSTSVLIRVAARAATEHRVACGLLINFEAGRLLVGTDVGTLAMVLSDDDELIDRYLAACELLAVGDYLDLYGC